MWPIRSCSVMLTVDVRNGRVIGVQSFGEQRFGAKAAEGKRVRFESPRPRRRWLVQQAQNRVSKSGAVIWRNKKTRFLRLDQLRQASNQGSDDGSADGHPFQARSRNLFAS